MDICTACIFLYNAYYVYNVFDRGEVQAGLPDWKEEDKVHLGEELSDVLLYLVRLGELFDSLYFVLFPHYSLIHPCFSPSSQLIGVTLICPVPLLIK